MLCTAYWIKFKTKVVLYVPRINLLSLDFNIVYPDASLIDTIEKFEITLDDSFVLTREELLKEMYEQEEQTALRKVPPLGFSVLTNKCNMSCEFCYAHKNSDTDSDFDIAWVDKLKQILPESSFSYCNFSGGEPLLVWDTVKELRSRFKDVTIYTNGSLLDESKVEWLLQSNTRLYVNLDYAIKGFKGHDSSEVRLKLDNLLLKYPRLKDLLKLSVVIPTDKLDSLATCRTQKKSFEVGLPTEFNFTAGSIPNSEFFEGEVKKVDRGELKISDSIFLRYLRYLWRNHVQGTPASVVSCDPSLTLNYRGDLFACHIPASSHTAIYDKYKLCSVMDFNIESYQKKIIELRYRGTCPETNCSAKWYCGNICWANLEVNKYLCELANAAFPFALYLYLNYADSPNFKSLFVTTNNTPLN